MDWIKDIWNYIKKEKIQLPEIYFAHEREVVKRGEFYLPISPYLKLKEGEIVEKKHIRFRTVGDMTCSIPHDSNAKSIEEVIEEIALNKFSERYARFDDKVSTYAMEKRKKEGYF